MSTYPIKHIQIGVSSCLLGHKVRYDGQDKQHRNVLKLCEQFDCVAICPETAIGLGVPRPPLQLVQIASEIHARGITRPHHDVTDSLAHYANTIFHSLPTLCGYVFKARSPSCGINSTPVFSEASAQRLGTSSGIYSGRIQQLAEKLPVIEETGLNNNEDVVVFIDKVVAYANVKSNSA
ncbi:MAG TPA: DUF523 domain-containing protein [Gammaproteobacteria bacterium]